MPPNVSDSPLADLATLPGQQPLKAAGSDAAAPANPSTLARAAAANGATPRAVGRFDNVVLAGLAAGCAVAFGFVPMWAWLPVVTLFLEMTAYLYDAGVLGRVEKAARVEGTDGVFSWEEVARHNVRESAWIAVKGVVYDVTEFLEKHPGGKEILLLCCGRDATDLFISYHPFTEKPEAVLPKYKIGTVSSYEHPVFKPDSGFYKELTTKVNDYFVKNNIDHKAPATAFLRMVPVYVVGIAAFYLTYLSTALPFSVRVATAVLVGVCQGLPLTGWMHDCSHAALGHSESYWWYIGRFALDWVCGSSMVAWRNQHVIGHHVYTNVLCADPDLPVSTTGDVRRLVPEQVWASFYQYQHLYLPPLYGILGLKSRFQDVFDVFYLNTNGPIRVNKIPTQDYLRQAGTKAFWFFLRFVIPVVFFNASWSTLLPLFFVTEFATGYYLAFNFQVSHVSTECDYLISNIETTPATPAAPGAPPVVHTQFAEEWSKHQVQSSLDYGHDSAFWTYFSGALNYQTVHHLLPTVSQYHYPAITPILRELCEKHGVRFNYKDTFGEAFGAHIGHLKKMGAEGKPAELKLE